MSAWACKLHPVALCQGQQVQVSLCMSSMKIKTSRNILILPEQQHKVIIKSLSSMYRMKSLGPKECFWWKKNAVLQMELHLWQWESQCQGVVNNVGMGRDIKINWHKCKTVDILRPKWTRWFNNCWENWTQPFSNACFSNFTLSASMRESSYQLLPGEQRHNYVQCQMESKSNHLRRCAWAAWSHPALLSGKNVA